MLVISNYSNFLSISLRLKPNSPKEEVVEKNLALPHDILSRSEVINVEKYTEKLKETLVELKINYKQVPCVFLVDPSKVNFRFIKNSKDIDEKEELGKVLQELGINENDYYFSGQKRTPLFSQFVCINKKSFDDILEVGAKLNLRITGIFSYLSLLSRLKNISEKSAFVSSYLGNAVVLFTRYGGIFFNIIYGQFTNIENSNKLMRLISENKQSGSIDEVYSFNFETPEMSLSLGINEINISNSEKFQNPIHALTDQVLRDENSDIFGSNFNFINLIVEEPKEAKSNILVKISLSALVLFLTLGVGGYYYFYPQQISQVLSSFTSTQEKAEPTPTEEVIKDFDVTKQPTAIEEANKNDPENTNKEGDSSVQIDGEAIDLDALVFHVRGPSRIADRRPVVRFASKLAEFACDSLVSAFEVRRDLTSLQPLRFRALAFVADAARRQEPLAVRAADLFVGDGRTCAEQR